MIKNSKLVIIPTIIADVPMDFDVDAAINGQIFYRRDAEGYGFNRQDVMMEEVYDCDVEFIKNIKKLFDTYPEANILVIKPV